MIIVRTPWKLGPPRATAPVSWSLLNWLPRFRCLLVIVVLCVEQNGSGRRKKERARERELTVGERKVRDSDWEWERTERDRLRRVRQRVSRGRTREKELGRREGAEGENSFLWLGHVPSIFFSSGKISFYPLINWVFTICVYVCVRVRACVCVRVRVCACVCVCVLCFKNRTQLLRALYKNIIFLDFYLSSYLFLKLVIKISFFLVNNLFIMVSKQLTTTQKWYIMVNKLFIMVYNLFTIDKYKEKI